MAAVSPVQHGRIGGWSPVVFGIVLLVCAVGRPLIYGASPRPFPHPATPMLQDGGDVGDEPDFGYRALTSTGIHPEHPSLNLLPFETIDVASGNVSLSFTDLTIAADGLLSVSIPRTWNSKHGLAVSLPIGSQGYIRYADMLPGDDEFPYAWELSPYPVIVTADGAEHPTGGVEGLSHGNLEVFHGAEGDFWEVGWETNTVVFMTGEFWRFDRRTHQLQLPNGVTIDYAGSTTLYPTRATDPFGNTIEYGANAITLRRHDGETRTIEIHRDADATRVVFEGKTWTYGAAGQWVTLPTGESWSLVEDSIQQTATLTMPTGAQITYHFQGAEYPCGDLYPNVPAQTCATKVVTSRTVTGPGLENGTWTFGYGTFPDGSLANSRERTVTGPDGIRIEYTNLTLEDGASFTRRTYDGTTLRETLTQATNLYRVGWSMVPPEDWWPTGQRAKQLISQAPYAVRPGTRTVIRDGRSYTTTYTYPQEYLAARWPGDDIFITSEPLTITEQGDGPDRVTTTQSYSDPFTYSPYMARRVKEQTVQQGGGVVYPLVHLYARHGCA